jgi:phytoene synthase
VVATTTDARIGEIRLAWWRERLEALTRGEPPPAQPVLLALAAHGGPALDAAALAGLEDGPLNALAGDWPRAAALRGERLFALAARLLGGAPAAGLGRAWAAGEAARGGHGVPRVAADRCGGTALWPLAGLDRLGARDQQRHARGLPPERRATPARQLILARAALLG